jgi:subtilisin family serine protease
MPMILPAIRRLARLQSRAMSRALAAFSAAGVLVLLATGCGGSGSGAGGSGPIYTAKATVPCLREKGFRHVTTAAAKVGLIASVAEHGGLRATARSGNTVTIAFTASAEEVGGTERAFRRFAKGVYKGHIRDVMRAQGNAVLVWAETPSDAELADALGCLRS